MEHTSVLLHGWSASSQAMVPIKNHLESIGIKTISIDYPSRENAATITDIAKSLIDVLLSNDLFNNKEEQELSFIVHSTGALLIREMLRVSFNKDYDFRNRIKYFIMLAPANHGSPIADNGNTFLGAIAKGQYNWFGEDFMEVGSQILHALELSSEKQWQITSFDRFSNNIYGDDKIKAYCFVGTSKYRGIGGIANRKGTDSVVTISGVSLNVSSAVFNFADKSYNLIKSEGNIHTEYFNSLDHSTILSDAEVLNKISDIVTGKPPKQSSQISSIDETYTQWLTKCVDKDGLPIKNYRILFNLWEKNGDYYKNENISGWERISNDLMLRPLMVRSRDHTLQTVIENTEHINSQSPENHRLLIDISLLNKLFKEGYIVSMSLVIGDNNDNQCYYIDRPEYQTIVFDGINNDLLPANETIFLKFIYDKHRNLASIREELKDE